ncbi:MAG TPA: hypothetical protein VGI97_01690, partial [Gemmatimonadaceae bacterium]
RALPPEPAYEIAARRALGRWLRRRGAREAGGGTPGAASAARRALLARLDATLRQSPAHTRAAIAGRIAHMRVLTRAAVSAGAEHALDRLARHESPDVASWLDACERELSGALAHSENAGHHLHTVRALLLVRRHP